MWNYLRYIVKVKKAPGKIVCALCYHCLKWSERTQTRGVRAHTGWGRSRFAVVIMRNRVCSSSYLFIIVLFSI